jgi:hypothetical protein
MALVAAFGTEVQLPVRIYEAMAYRLEISKFFIDVRSLAAGLPVTWSLAG